MNVAVTDADGINQSVHLLSGLDRFVHLQPAAGASPSEQDDCASRVLGGTADQLFRSGENRIPNRGRSGEGLIGSGDWRAVNDDATADVAGRRNKLDSSIARRRRSRFPEKPCSSVVSPVNDTIAASSLLRNRFSRNARAAFGQAACALRKRWCRSDRKRQRQIDVGLESEDILFLTVFKHADVFRFQVADEPFVLSAAVKKMLVRLVSTLITSSESCGNSSRDRGVGEGDGIAMPIADSLFAEKLRVANPPHRQ